MLHLVVGHIDLHAAKGFTVGFRYMSPILVNPFFAILVLIDNDILSRIFARNVLSVGFLLRVRQPPLHIVVAAVFIFFDIDFVIISFSGVVVAVVAV